MSLTFGKPGMFEIGVGCKFEKVNKKKRIPIYERGRGLRRTLSAVFAGNRQTKALDCENSV